MPELKLASTLALTPEGSTHTNRLRPGGFGVAGLKLKAPGGATSKTYRPAPAPAVAGGTDDFHFAPALEKVKLTYALDNALGGVETAKLELFTRHNKSALWTRELKGDELKDGAHELEWDGKVAKTADFPDEYVTVEFSPYKLRLTLTGKGLPEAQVAWTYFHVLVGEIELSLGDKAVLKEARDKALYETLGGKLPKPKGKPAELRLLSNLFKRSAAEMNDNTAFTEYKTAWADGPSIPIFATVRVRNSKDQKVDAPKALGKVKFLWDWEDVAESTSRHHAKARTYLNNSLDYSRAATEPNGDNCHEKHGGKRGKPSQAVFPTQAGYAPAAALTAGAFPFKVEACSTRKWAVYSQAWTSGALAGKTGVLFQPARMAGDGYVVTVYLAFDRKPDGSVTIDVKDKPPLGVVMKQATGTFELWREVHLIKHIKKTAALAGFSVGTVQDYYEKANIRMEDKAGVASVMTEADYNLKVTTAVAAQPFYIQAAIDPATNQYTAGTHAITFRDYADFLAAVRVSRGWTVPQLNVWLAGGGAAVNTEAKYNSACMGFTDSIVTSAFDGYLDAKDGVNIVQFAGFYNLESRPGGVPLNGIAADFASAGRHRCAFVQCATAASYTGNSNRMEQTITHEVGHHLFLPHAPFPAGDLPGGALPDVHDKTWINCMMGYDYTAERKFCGLCILRLRGWDKTFLDQDGTLNKKP